MTIPFKIDLFSSVENHLLNYLETSLGRRVYEDEAAAVLNREISDAAEAVVERFQKDETYCRLLLWEHYLNEVARVKGRPAAFALRNAQHPWGEPPAGFNPRKAFAELEGREDEPSASAETATEELIPAQGQTETALAGK